MSARKPFTFTSTPAARTSPYMLRDRGYSIGDTVWTDSVNTDGSLRPDGDREVYVFADADAMSRGVYALASTLSPKDDGLLKVGDRVEYIGSETSRHIGKVGTVTRVDDMPGRYAGADWTADCDALPSDRFAYARNLRKITAPTELKVGDRVVIAEGATLSSGGYVSPSAFGKVGTIRSKSGRDFQVVGAGFDQYVGPDHLTIKTAPTPAPEPTLAERFPVGRLVVTSANPKTKEGGYVAPEFRGVVAEVKGSTFGDVRITLPNGERPFLTNIVGPAHLTLLPEGVELVKPTVREPLSFTDAYEKAVAHRGAPTTAKQVAKASKLAELLIEVSK